MNIRPVAQPPPEEPKRQQGIPLNSALRQAKDRKKRGDTAPPKGRCHAKGCDEHSTWRHTCGAKYCTAHGGPGIPCKRCEGA